MSSWQGGGWWMVGCAALVACGECTTCAPTAESVHEDHGRRVAIHAQAFRNVGVDGIGAPHVGGIVWPTIDGTGYRVVMRVDERPEVVLQAEATDGMPDGSELEAAVEAMEVDVSPDGQHVAVRLDDWRLFHLLPEGVPFDVPGEPPDGDAVDWDAVAEPERIALAALAGEGHGDEYPLLWEAVTQQPPGEPWDSAILGAWPATVRAQRHVERIAQRSPPPSDAWRSDAFGRARGVIEGEGGERQAAFRLLHLLGGEALAWLDAEMLRRWGDEEAPAEPRAEGRGHLQLALNGQTRSSRREPMDDELLRDGVAVARGVIDACRPPPEDAAACADDDFRLGISWVEAHGTEADREHLRDALLDVWPDPDRLGVHLAVMGWMADDATPDAWRARAVRRALSSLDHPETRRPAAELILRADDEAARDRALDALFERLDTEDTLLLVRRVEDATVEERQALVRQADAVLSDRPGPDAPRPERERASHAAQIAFVVQRDDADCDRLRELAEVPRELDSRVWLRIPERCQTPAPP